MTSRNGRTPKRRRRSFGRVCQRANGRGWYAQFPDPSGAKTSNGRTRYTTRSVASKKEGEVLLREVRKAMVRGLYAAPEPKSAAEGMTVTTALDGYIEAKVAQGRAAKTVRGYRSSRKVIAASPLGRMCIPNVKPRDVEGFMAWRRERTWRTRRRILEYRWSCEIPDPGHAIDCVDTTVCVVWHRSG